MKYHDIGLRGWLSARDAVVADLEKELDKVVNKYKVPCHAYVMITNVPFTGARNVGTRDKITETAKEWINNIPDILVWDAADFSRILDANESVRTAYLDTILPGDVLRAIFTGATFHDDRTRSALRAYLKFVTDRERFARAEEAGDDPGLPLEQVFVDLSLRPSESAHESVQNVQASWPEGKEQGPVFTANRFMPTDYRKTPASFALLVAEYPSLLILRGPGLGKSTLTQFLALYHAARAVDRPSRRD